MTIKDIRLEEEIPLLLDTMVQLGTGIRKSGLWKHRTKSGMMIDVEITSHGRGRVRKTPETGVLRKVPWQNQNQRRPQLGVGSTFHVYLPAFPDRIRREPGYPAATARGSDRILIVDDEEMIRDVASRMLRSEGYDTECAQDGQISLVLYAKAQKSGKPFDAVIPDLTIPGGLGGKETIQRLLEMDPRARAIVSSGYSSDPIMARFREYGFKGVAAKPYSIKTLSSAVHAVLQEGS